MKRWETAFRQAYEKWETGSAVQRELACLRVQFPALLQPVREKDLLAGIVTWRAVGFSPKDDSEFGYFLRDGLLAREMEAAGEAERQELLETGEYFRTRRGKSVTRTLMDGETNRILCSDSLEDEFPAYPLYRMTGCIVDYNRLLEQGIGGLKEIVEKGRACKPEQADFYDGLAGALDLLADCCLFYAKQCVGQAEDAEPDRKKELCAMAENLEWIADKKPETFWQAAQLAWLYSALAHTLDYGRMDDYLGGFLKRDLDSGRLTTEMAQRITDSLWLLIADKRTTVHGRVVIGGRGRRDEAAADLFARYAMEATLHVRRNEPQLSLRWYQGMEEGLLDKAMELLGAGTTFPILYNDDVNIPNVEKAFRVSREEAKQYYPFGCGEYVIAGKSFGSPNGVLNLARVLELTMHQGKSPETGHQLGPAEKPCEAFADFEDFYRAYIRQAAFFIRALAKQQAATYRAAAQMGPFLFLSLLYDDCIARGKGVFDGGIEYLGGTLECYGNITASDSLLAVKKLVFEEKKLTLAEMNAILESDFAEAGQRDWFLAVPKYGNGEKEADEMAARMHDDIAELIAAQAAPNGMSTYLPVLINNDHNVKFGKYTGATPDGRRRGTPLTNANSPTGGQDKNGVTALLVSMATLRGDNNAGMVQNLRLGKEQFGKYREKTKALLAAYFALGGTQLMITSVSARELRDAMVHPELYQNLFVRVGGYSGRFISLPKEVQLDIIGRTVYGDE